MPQISSLFDWFADRPKSSPSIQQQQEREIADGLWTKCQNCNAIAYSKDIIANQMVCLECGHQVDSRYRHRSVARSARDRRHACDDHTLDKPSDWR